MYSFTSCPSRLMTRARSAAIMLLDETNRTFMMAPSRTWRSADRSKQIGAGADQPDTERLLNQRATRQRLSSQPREQRGQHDADQQHEEWLKGIDQENEG